MKSSAVLSKDQILLVEEHVYFGGMSLTYRLSVLTVQEKNRFSIRVQKDEESDEVDAGTDLSHAMHCYRSIVDGTVTPCALRDVMRELQYT